MRVGYNKAQMICTPELMEIITPRRGERPSVLKEALQAGDEFFFKCLQKFGKEFSYTEIPDQSGPAHTYKGPLLPASAATAALAVLLLAVAAFVLIVVRHRTVCERDDCPHRHPGFLHSMAAAFGVRACSGGCPSCNWDGAEPDMNVSIDEIAHCLVPKAFVAQGACGNVYRGTWRGRGALGHLHRMPPSRAAAAAAARSSDGIYWWTMSIVEEALNCFWRLLAWWAFFRGGGRTLDVAIKHVAVGVADDSIYDTFLKELEAGKRFGKCDRMLPLLGACLERPNVCLIHEFAQGEC